MVAVSEGNFANTLASMTVVAQIGSNPTRERTFRRTPVPSGRRSTS